MLVYILFANYNGQKGQRDTYKEPSFR